METTRMMNKKGASITSIFMVILIGIVAFIAFFSFVSMNASEASVTIESEYNDSITRFQEYQGETQTVYTDIKNKFSGVTEPQNVVNFFFSGLSGMWAVIKAPLALINIATNAFGDYLSVYTGIIPIPSYIIGAIAMAIGVIIIFALIALVTGRSGGGY